MAAASVAAIQTSLAASNGGARRIEGAWLVEVTLRDCTTNAPIGTINSLVAFHDGGTISGTPSRGAFAIGQRSDGHGRWTRQGATAFRQKMVAHEPDHARRTIQVTRAIDSRFAAAIRSAHMFGLARHHAHHHHSGSTGRSCA